MRAIGILVGALVAFVGMAAPAHAVQLQTVDSYSGSVLEVTAPQGDQRLFVVTQAGQVLIRKTTGTLATPFLDISATATITTNQLVTAGGERGLLSLAFDPDYATNGLFYVAYTGTGTTAGGSDGDLHLDEFKVSSTDADVADPASRRQVLTIPHSGSFGSTNHNGGDLHFKGGYLYWSTGDGGGGGDTFHNGQNKDTLLGKLLRIDPHQSGTASYTPPSTNPFFGGGVAGADEVWSYGLRNPFRWSFDSADGALVIGDVGQNAREEIDYDPPGAGAGFGDNFGWNCREGLIPYTASAPDAICATEPYPASFTDPVFDYPHSNPGGGAAFGCAVIGGFVYHGSQIPELAGRYLYSDSCNGTIRSIVLDRPFACGDRSEGISVSSPSSIVEIGGEPFVTTTGGALYKLASSGSGSPNICAKSSSSLAKASVTLAASKRRVRRGSRVRITVKAQCPDSTGESVQLQRNHGRTLTRALDANCQATFRPRVLRGTRFVAVLPQNAAHGAATSASIKVKLIH